MVAIACVCPPTAAGETRHPNGDTVTLRERLDFRSALTCRMAIVNAKQDDPFGSEAELQAAMIETFVLVGVESWSVVDERNKRVEVSRPAIRKYLFDNPVQAMEVGEEAHGLYYDVVIAPLVGRALQSTQPTPTSESTSATEPGKSEPPTATSTSTSSKSRTPSKRSSTSTTPTDGIGATSMSLDGGSSTSPNSV